MIRFQCPSCAREWGLSNKAAGTLWECPNCHAQVNVPAGSPSPDPEHSHKPRHSKAIKRKKSSAAIPQSPDAGFELLEGGSAPEPFIPVAEDAPTHSKIRKKLQKRNDPTGASSVEIDHVAIADSDMNGGSVPASPATSALKPRDDLPMALVDSQAALPVGLESRAPEPDIPVVELASSPAILLGTMPGTELEKLGSMEDDHETGSTKKKKKKKRGSGFEDALESHGNSIVAIAMVGLALLVVAIGGGISLWKNIADQKPSDPGPAIAYLQKRGAHIERDRTQPDEPVVAVVMAGLNVNVDDIIRLKDFTKLRKLNLSHTNVNVTAIDYIADMKSLRSLNLDSANIGDGVTGLLGGLTNLEELYLNNTRVSDPGLKNLYGLTNLRILGLEGSRATGFELQQHLPHVKIVRDNAIQRPALDPDNP
jgi:hypothetical protein